MGMNPRFRKAVSNASPLISLARVDQLNGLRELFEVVYVSVEVYTEFVFAGAGMPGASAIRTPVGFRFYRFKTRKN